MRVLGGQPELAVDRVAQGGRADVLRGAEARLRERAVEPRRGPAARVRVRLDLDERDGRLGERSIGVRDGVARVLPTLVDEAGLGSARVLEEAVAVAIAEAIHPIERGVEARPELTDELDVGRRAVVLGEQDDEERRRVDGAVVGREGHGADARELAASELVHDLARLLVALRIVVFALMPHEQAERLARGLGRHPEVEQRRDDRVAPEEARVPRDARGDEGRVRITREQHAQIAAGSREDRVEEGVRRLDADLPFEPLLVARDRRARADGRRGLVAPGLGLRQGRDGDGERDATRSRRGRGRRGSSRCPPRVCPDEGRSGPRFAGRDRRRRRNESGGRSPRARARGGARCTRRARCRGSRTCRRSRPRSGARPRG